MAELLGAARVRVQPYARGLLTTFAASAQAGLGERGQALAGESIPGPPLHSSEGFALFRVLVQHSVELVRFDVAFRVPLDVAVAELLLAEIAHEHSVEGAVVQEGDVVFLHDDLLLGVTCY